MNKKKEKTVPTPEPTPAPISEELANEVHG